MILRSSNPPPARKPRSSLPEQRADGGIKTNFGRSSAGRKSVVYPPTGWQPKTDASKLPDCTLKREYVYGYNGACKQSLHFISAEECVYPVAALVVIQNLEDVGQQRFYEGHSRAVQCLAWNERRGLCASGQSDVKGSAGAHICIWAPKYCDRTISELHHHERQVSAIALSPDGEIVVSCGGDDAHCFCIWRDFASWDGIKGPEHNPGGQIIEPERKKAPIYTCSSGRCLTRAICMGPWLRAEQGQGERQQRTVVFYTIGESSESGNKTSGMFKFWTLRSNGRTEKPDVSQKRGVFGKAPAVRFITSIAYAEDQTTAFLVGDTGFLYVLREGSVIQDQRILPQNSKACLGVVTAISGGRWLVGSSDGALYIGSCAPVPTVQVQMSIAELLGPEGELFCTTALARCSAAAVQDDRLLLGTSNDVLMLADLRCRGTGQILQVSHSAEAWALDFHPSLAILVTASRAKDVRFWNIADRRPAVGKVLRLEQEVWSVAFNAEGTLLAVGCGRGVLEVLAFPSLQPVFRQALSSTAAKKCEQICDVRFSCDSTWLAAACWDQAIYLLKVAPTRPTEPGDPTSHRITHHKVLSGNSSSPVSIMFSADGEHLMSNSKDSQILFWRTKDGSLQNSISQYRDAVWQTPWTCVLGWQVLGVWDNREYDQTDVNSVCQSFAPQDGYLALGDDRGKLKLFRFPCPFVDQPFREFGGFGSHVTAVKFSRSNVLVALGGDDRSISQWSLDKSREQRRNLEPEPLVHPWVQLEEAEGGPRDEFGFLGRPRSASLTRARHHDGYDHAGLDRERPLSASRRASAKIAPRRAVSAVAPGFRRDALASGPSSPMPSPQELQKPLLPPSPLSAVLPPRVPVAHGKDGYYRNHSRGVSSALQWD